jgi:hypothetical protein
MRLSANRIRSINRTLAISNGRPFYNQKPLAPSVPDTTYCSVVFVPASRS